MRSAVLGSLLFWAAGCGGGHAHPEVVDAENFYDCSTEPRAVPAVVGLVGTSSAHVLSASLDALLPGAIVKGNNTWDVRISDASGQVEGATVKVMPFMPDHGHGTSVKVGVTELGSGAYRLTPLYLYMGGYWEITLNVTTSAGTSDALMFPVCVPG